VAVALIFGVLQRRDLPTVHGLEKRPKDHPSADAGKQEFAQCTVTVQ
jgi:hypothetical protein